MPPPRTAAASLLLSGELGDSLTTESATPPTSARPQVQGQLENEREVEEAVTR